MDNKNTKSDRYVLVNRLYSLMALKAYTIGMHMSLFGL
jgi:hypothetical protein